MKLFKKLSIFLAVALVICLTLSINTFATEVDSTAEAVTEAVSEQASESSKLDMNLSGADMSLNERLGYALQGTVTGMLMIFAVLGLLAIIVSLSKVVFFDIPNKKREAEKASKMVSAPVEAPKPQVAEEPAQDEEFASAEDDTQLAAVITAAIAAMLDSEQYSNEFQSGFRVVSFKRVNTNGAWNKK